MIRVASLFLAGILAPKTHHSITHHSPRPRASVAARASAAASASSSFPPSAGREGRLTVVVAVPVLFAVLGSEANDAVALSVMVVPPARDGLVFTVVVDVVMAE